MNKTGKILSLKTGYNPNSSSIGSHIPTFLALASGLGFMTIVTLNQIKRINKLIRDKKDDLKPTRTDSK